MIESRFGDPRDDESWGGSSDSGLHFIIKDSNKVFMDDYSIIDSEYLDQMLEDIKDVINQYKLR